LQNAIVSEPTKLTVRGKGTALLGSSSFLASSSALLHGHLHTACGFGFGDEDLGSLLEHASAVLNGIVRLVEVAGDGCVVDLE
jgi:hypothetical protein